MTEKINLKSINELLGEHFFIPHYQRGYRWTSQQVEALLNDVWSFTKESKGFYCLQPVVVKEKKWTDDGITYEGWEVIDGQQRLTTIHIILSYFAKEFLKIDDLKDEYGKSSFTIRYETRPKSQDFLKNITFDKSNIDFFHIFQAYETVKVWFNNPDNIKDRTDKNRFFGTLLGKKADEQSVQIIWYNAEQHTDSIELFTRLNIGKIPLTNAELIKGLFLSSSSFKDAVTPDNEIRRKMEVSQLWDEMEQKLGDDDFWAFITNKKKKDFSTKIELLFDFISRKKDSEIDPLYTFLFFFKKFKSAPNDLWELWMEIESYYFTLLEWNKNKNLYHKIGYLVQTGDSIRDLIELSSKEEKDKFDAKLVDRIKTKVNFDIEQLNYEVSADYSKIGNLLLLFNTESIRSSPNINDFYPFKFHKDLKWSYEHIHAQNSEGLDKTKQEPWLKWLSYHLSLLQELSDSDSSNSKYKELIKEITDFNNQTLTWEKFSVLSESIIKIFSENNEVSDMHSISNLALLSQPDNSALNNSVFEVKRREIIDLDKNGNYIPICTRRVFLKYYSKNQSSQQYYFWSKEDKDYYLEEIRRILIDYLPII